MADNETPNENHRPQHQHLWIPEGEVQSLPKTLRGGETPRDVHHADHGERLLSGIQAIEKVHRAKPSTLEDTVVFKMKLAEREKLQNKVRQEFLETNRIRLNAVKDERTALVSILDADLNRLKTRIENYRRYDHYKGFQFLETLEPLAKEDRQSLELRRVLANSDLGEQKLDVQVQLLPNLGATTYGLVVARLNQIVRDEGGEELDEPFYMSNQTPVLHYFLPASAVEVISDDDSVFRIEITPTYEFQMPEEQAILQGVVQLDPEVHLDELPILAIADTGVELPGALAALCVGEWTAPGLQGNNRGHGTMVASRAVFGPTLKAQSDSGVMTPRVRVFSLHVSDGKISGPDLMRHIQQAVAALPQGVRIVNLSINQANKPVEDDALSIFANHLDMLAIKHGIMFVVSAGNQNVWQQATDLDEAFALEETRITSPADSYLAITAGAAVYFTNGTASDIDFAPYTRRGPGFGGNKKVNLLAEGGGASLNAAGGSVVTDPAWAISHLGGPHPVNGTSFAAPVVAGDLAEVSDVVPDGDLLLAHALLLHTATPIYDLDGYDIEDREFVQQIVGNGLSNPERARLSAGSSVTFIARGTLNRRTKQRVNFFVPTVLKAGNVRQPLVTVRVTCVTFPPLDYTKGQEYLGACVTASLKGFNGKGTMKPFNPAQGEGRAKWQPVQHFSATTGAFSSGDWQVWLELLTRWDTKDDQEVPYALCITVEDPAQVLDVYSAIQVEAQNRFQPMTRTRIRN